MSSRANAFQSFAANAPSNLRIQASGSTSATQLPSALTPSSGIGQTPQTSFPCRAGQGRAYEYKRERRQQQLALPVRTGVSATLAVSFTELNADRRTPADLLAHVAASGHEGLSQPESGVDRWTVSPLRRRCITRPAISARRRIGAGAQCHGHLKLAAAPTCRPLHNLAGWAKPSSTTPSTSWSGILDGVGRRRVVRQVRPQPRRRPPLAPCRAPTPQADRPSAIFRTVRTHARRH